MKKTMILAVPAIAIALFVAANVYAEEAVAPAKVAVAVKAEAVKGMVAVTKEGDKVTAVSLKAGEAVLKITGDAELVAKIAALDGKEVEVTGVKSADGKEIAAKSFKVVEAAK